jgi:hypothetical protein
MRVAILVLILLLLVAPIASATRSVFPKTDKGLWDLIDNARRNWTYEEDRPGELAQRPIISNILLKGDCDDFAIMIACYLQEYWGYDTYIILANWPDRGGKHCIAWLRVSEQMIKDMASICNRYLPWNISYPYMTKLVGRQKRFYMAIDWNLCPDWEWTYEGFSSVRQWEWYELVGKPI